MSPLHLGDCKTAMAESDVKGVETKKQKRSLGKILLMGGNGLLFLLGAGFFITTKMGLLEKTDVQHQPKTPKHTLAKVAAEEEMLPDDTKHVDFNLPPLVVNLSGDNGQRYLRITLQVHLRNEKDLQKADKQLIPIQNGLIFLLSSKTFQDISSVEGKYQLQNEIRQNLDDTLGHNVATRVYFREFVVQ